MAKAMTAKEAADYAPQWGSYMAAGDPGAALYGNLEDPETARLALAFLESDCVPIAKTGDCCGTAGPCGPDLESLGRLRLYLEARTKPETVSSGLEVDDATGAAAWASYLVNGDDSGLEAGEKALADAWAARLAPWYVVDVVRNESGEAQEARFSWSFGAITGNDCAGGELLDYVIHKAPGHAEAG